MNGYPRFGWVDILRFQHTMILKTNVRLRGAPAKPLKKTEYIAEDGHVFRKIKTAETMQSPRQSYKFIMYVWDQSLVLNPHIA